MKKTAIAFMIATIPVILSSLFIFHFWDIIKEKLANAKELIKRISFAAYKKLPSFFRKFFLKANTNFCKTTLILIPDRK